MRCGPPGRRVRPRSSSRSCAAEPVAEREVVHRAIAGEEKKGWLPPIARGAHRAASQLRSARASRTP
jgi:hypothetical protein